MLRAPDGARIAYRVAPAPPGAPLLVLLHGLASNATRWTEFVEHTRLRGRWGLLRLDLRGHGDSFTRRGIGLARWIEDLRELLDQEQHSSAVLAGHSVGAQLALQFAARHPQRCRALVLIDPVFREALAGALRPAARLAPLLRLLAAAIEALNCLGLRRRALPARDLRALDERARREWIERGGGRELAARYSSVWEDLRFFPVAAYLRELHVLAEPLPAPQALPMPVLALLSAQPSFVEPARVRRALARLPETTVEPLDTSHWPLTERPREVTVAIERWLDALGARNAP